MKFALSIWFILLSILCSAAMNEESMVIMVEAGNPTTICYGETLDISILGASISGDVDDGIWFTMGDGIFLPGNNSNGIFSTTTQYQPGLNDISNGSFTLILVSDDPDGNGPMVEVSDVVTISFMNAPALVCNNSINVSLAEGCKQAVDIFMLLANPTQPYNKYIIKLKDANGQLILNNTLTVDHIGTNITFTVGHQCTSNTCGGSIVVSDNIPPFLNCTNIEVECEFGLSPDVVGFPIPFYASVTPVDDNTFTVFDWDACGEVTLSFEDTEQEMSCAQTGYIKNITRAWFAEDAFGNTASCNQMIKVFPLPLSAVVPPQNYDGTSEDPLSCDGDWEALPNGYPSPNSTGSPIFPACSNIEAAFTDVYFNQCGAGFKIAREWFVIDWCSSQNININQIIKVIDATGPEFECPDDITISAQPYECLSESLLLVFVDSVYDCSTYTHSFKIWTQGGINISNQYIDNNILADLPKGSYVLQYIATDACNNSSDCSVNLTVIDDAPPFAICDGFTQIGVGSNGMADLLASSVDDGSFDNCGILQFDVAKMTDECSWGLQFGPKVHFCCDEIGDTIMVAFRVTDEVGLTNTCMVSVFVEDKLPPKIYCPTDLTIDCSVNFDLNDLSIFGSVNEGQASVEDIIINGEVLGTDGYFEDNCSATILETSTNNLDCGTGIIERIFTVTDAYNQSANCTQTITIINTNPFTESEITWPINYEMNGCDTIQADPTITGEPDYFDDKCALVASTYTDQYFYISGGACIKILREWTVIDWCQYQPGQNAGIWTYLQEIKLKNNIAPVFIACSDEDICSYDANCTSELVTIVAHVNDDCTDSLNLLYLWELDLDDDGNIDEAGQGISFTRELLYGKHRVFWKVEDGCGNIATCNYALTVRDCKNPTPYCKSSITTTIMPSAGQIQIWATDFDYGSTDNCTAPEDLQFSFSQDVNDDNRVITCEDIDNGVAQEFTFEFWVTDEYGNQERCFVTFIVQDNADICPNGTIKGKIAGKVATQKKKWMPEVEMQISASIDTFSGMEMTDSIGEYAFETTPEYLKYVLKPNYESDARSGVTTLDLVMIQQHILEIKLFDNPYDIIASDVSKNEKITSSDLLTMRKMILGIIVEWPKEINNWVFVDSSFQFPDEEDPFLYPDSITIDALKDTVLSANFVAVKMGDVNGSFKPSALKTEHIVGRDQNEIAVNIVRTKDANGDYIQELIFNELEIFDGLQFSVQIPEGAVIKSNFLSSMDYIVKDNVLKVAWVNTSEEVLDKRPFLTISSESSTPISLTLDLDPEVYINLDIYNLIMKESGFVQLTENADQTNFTAKVLSNPFSHDLRIEFDDPCEEAFVEVINSTGVSVYSDWSYGSSELRIDESIFERAGIYFVRLKCTNEIITKRVVKIK